MPGITMVMHTFGSKLNFNCHLHILYTLGGYSAKSGQWRACDFVSAESLKKRQHDYENILLSTWNIYENAKKEYEKKEQEHAEEVDRISTQLREKKEKIEAVEREIAVLEEQRKNKENGVPQEWLEHYARMRNTVSDPVVEIVSESCSACFYNIPQQDVISINRNKLVQCKGCYRFLYKKRDGELSE